MQVEKGNNMLPFRKFKKSLLLLLVMVLFGATYLTIYWGKPNGNALPQLWLRDAKVDMRKLLDESIKTENDFMTSKKNLRLLEDYSSSFDHLYKDELVVSCSDLFLGDSMAIERSRELMKQNSPTVLTSDYYFDSTRNCSRFLKERNYMPLPESQEEAEFPIAFSILIYKDFQLAERLLRAIYAPQNFYCLHVDAKAPNDVKEVLRKVAGCLPNVFLPHKLIPVSWGHISIMHAEMMCMEELLKYKWKYFINLSGQMFPTRSNAELVQVLKLFKGANDVEGSSNKARNIILSFRQLVEWRHSNTLDMNIFTFRLKSNPPHNVTIYTGTNQVILSRAFVVYFLYSKVSQDIIEWYSNTLVPDEYIWSTLNHNAHLNAPGAYRGNAENKPTLARLSLWNSPTNKGTGWTCQGTYVRELCIFGVGDLQWLIQQPQLFVNKFHSDFEWLGLDCMEELVFNRTRNNLLDKVHLSRPFDLSSDVSLNMTFYRNVPFVKNTSLVISVRESEMGRLLDGRGSSDNR